jgi:hypothetical protein
MDDMIYFSARRDGRRGGASVARANRSGPQHVGISTWKCWKARSAGLLDEVKNRCKPLDLSGFPS